MILETYTTHRSTVFSQHGFPDRSLQWWQADVAWDVAVVSLT